MFGFLFFILNIILMTLIMVMVFNIDEIDKFISDRRQ